MSDTKLREALPCPFCGSKPEVGGGDYNYPWVVECINPDCPVLCAMDGADRKAQAIAAWNTRAALSTPCVEQDADEVERVAKAMAPTIFAPFSAKEHGSPVNQQATQKMWLEKSLAALSAIQSRDAGLSPAARDVLAERREQITREGWTPEHDDTHSNGALAAAAACYARGEIIVDAGKQMLWPWHPRWWKPGNRRRELVKAGALILAEIERLDRAALQMGGEKP